MPADYADQRPAVPPWGSPLLEELGGGTHARGWGGPSARLGGPSLIGWAGLLGLGVARSLVVPPSSAAGFLAGTSVVPVLSGPAWEGW
jgi:hypothetical protein